MSYQKTCLGILFVGSALVLAGCSSDSSDRDLGAGGSGGSSGSGGSGGSGGTTATGGVALTWDETGWIDGSGNDVGIQGPWFDFNDCEDSPDDCTQNHEFETTATEICTSGTTAQVNSEEEFSTKWGASIAFEPNSEGGEDPVKMPYDAAANGVVGFAFNISGSEPSTGVRVNITNSDTNDTAHFKTVLPGGEATVMFDEIMQGSWVEDTQEFDPSDIMAVQFQVPSEMDSPVDFDFCISDLRALTE